MLDGWGDKKLGLDGCGDTDLGDLVGASGSTILSHWLRKVLKNLDAGKILEGELVRSRGGNDLDGL